MLFSEPKIPQLDTGIMMTGLLSSFSALQRAENSSIGGGSGEDRKRVAVSVLFSEPKIPQSVGAAVGVRAGECFSALQRAENSSIFLLTTRNLRAYRFQCSSASRKFLNAVLLVGPAARFEFQCSSASRKFLNIRSRRYR